jgi:hypothetical protein
MIERTVTLLPFCQEHVDQVLSEVRADPRMEVRR